MKWFSKQSAPKQNDIAYYLNGYAYCRKRSHLLFHFFNPVSHYKENSSFAKLYCIPDISCFCRCFIIFVPIFQLHVLTSPLYRLPPTCSSCYFAPSPLYWWYRPLPWPSAKSGEKACLQNRYPSFRYHLTKSSRP